MLPSKDDFILKLLAQSVARVNSDFREKEQEEEEVTFVKLVKKVKDDEPETLTTSTDIIVFLIVYHHLKEVAPNLAEELSKVHTCKHVSKHLKEVSPELAEELFAIIKLKQNKGSKENGNKSTGHILRKFTPQEDSVIKDFIESAGDGSIDHSALAKKLGTHRTIKSLISRIESLKRNGGRQKKIKQFTLVEDTMILESLVIPRVGKEKLSKIVLQKHNYAAFTEQLDKSTNAVMRRWVNILQPWLMQHYSGTLNLRVERMLANFISENFYNFSTIDWREVATKSEFSGHTDKSLKQIYFKLSSITNIKFGLPSDEVSPQHISKYCELVYGEKDMGQTKAGIRFQKKMKRQTDVIAYFERRMGDLNLNDFV